MNKKSQVNNLWPQIYQKLKSPPPGVNLGSFPGKLPPMNKIVIDSDRLQENSQAIGYVSTEDVDQNGKLDTIHISSPRLEEAMRSAGVPLENAQNLNQLSNEELIRVLTPFVELLSHEMGHLTDFKPNQDNPFPGGEGVAETAARSAIQPISLATTNIHNSFDKKGKIMNSKLLKSLVRLGNYLDQVGALEIADHVDHMINKHSQQSAGFEMPEPQAEPGNLDFQTPLKHMKDSMKGNVQPKGDPYTYNYNKSDRTFTIATVPMGKENLVGHVIKPGQGGYDQLLTEAQGLGLVEDTELNVTSDPVGGQLNQSLAQLGLGPAGSIVPESLDPLIMAKKSLFIQAMSELADSITASAGQSGPAQSMLLANLKAFKNPNLSGREAIEVFNKKIQPLLMVTVGPEASESFKTDFKNQVLLWHDVDQLQKLKSQVASYKMSADGKTLSDLSNAADDVDLDKSAELEQFFWLKSNNPFFRSNEKYTRR